MSPATGTLEGQREREETGVRARHRLREAEGACNRARLRYVTAAGKHFAGALEDADLEATESTYEAALRALRRAQAAHEGLTGIDSLPALTRS